MANGDAAAAAGLATFAPTQDIRMGYDNDNIRGDELAAHLTNGTHPASAITSGTFSADRIPSLDSSKITTGGFDASRITTGSLSADRIPNLDASKITAGTITRPVNASGTITASGLITGNGGITASADGISTSGNIVGAATYNQTNTGRAMYVASNGLYGIGSSARRFKKNITDAVFDVSEVLKIRVRNFMYKKDFGGDETLQVGVIAEELLEVGLDQFVYFNEAGEADGVAYEKLALALIPVIQDQESRIQALESKVN